MSLLSSPGPFHENATALPSGENAGIDSAPESAASGRTTMGPASCLSGAAVECSPKYRAPAISAAAMATAGTIIRKRRLPVSGCSMSRTGALEPWLRLLLERDGISEHGRGVERC